MTKNMFRIFFLALLYSGFSSGFSQAQKADISIIQGDPVELSPAANGVYEGGIQGQPFIISFKGEEIYVSTSLEAEPFYAIETGADANADFNTPFYVFKAEAMPPDADYLSADGNASLTINVNRGAQDQGNGHLHYLVNRIFDGEDKYLNLSDLETLYISLWLDPDLDKIIDEGELLQVKLTIGD